MARSTQLLRGLQLLVLAIVAIVGAGLASPGAIAASLAHPVPVAAKTAHAPRWTSGHPFSRSQDAVASPAVDRDAVVIDLADDDLDDEDIEHRGELRLHVGRDGSFPLRGARISRRPQGNLRAHPQFDRSRFRTGRGLLRGPPA